MRAGNFMAKDMPGHTRRHSAMSCAKMAQLMEIAFRLWTRMGPRKDVLHGGALWLWRNLGTQLNRPCAAAMQPFCQYIDYLLVFVLVLITTTYR